MSKAKSDFHNSWKRVNPSDNVKEGGQGRGFLVRRVDSLDPYLYFLKELKDSNSDERRSRFRSEVLALRKLKHTLIPEIIDDNVDKYGDKAVRLYFVSQYFEGCTLRELVDNKGFLSFEESLRIVMSILNTLAYCHDEGVLHRDIKPDNVVLNAAMQPALIDFGQAWIEDGDSNPLLTPNEQHMGNRFLVLPESTTYDADISAKRDRRSDVALSAAVLLYLLTGVSPSSLVDADGNMPHQRQLTRRQLMQIDEPVRTRLLRLFDTAFQQKIELRFQSADALRAELGKLQEPLETEVSSDITTAMQGLKSMPKYKLQKQAMDVMDNISDGLKTSVEEFSRRVLRNEFTFSLTLQHRGSESISHQIEGRNRVLVDIWLRLKIVFRIVGSEMISEVSSDGREEQLYRCRIDEYQNSSEFQGVFKDYLKRAVSRLVENRLS